MVNGSVRRFSVYSDVSKYRDPLHILLDYIAEVSTSYCTTGLVSCLFCLHYGRFKRELRSKRLIAIWCLRTTMT